MKLPQLDAAAKAQAWGLAVSFALSFWLTYRMELGLRLFLVACFAVWVLWEFTGGRRASASRHATPLALASGLAIPWIGFLTTWLLAALKP